MEVFQCPCHSNSWEVLIIGENYYSAFTGISECFQILIMPTLQVTLISYATTKPTPLGL